MTEEELKQACATAVRVARMLRRDLGRLPTTMEIKWRLATVFETSSPMTYTGQLTRQEAMTLAHQMLNVLSTAANL